MAKKKDSPKTISEALSGCFLEIGLKEKLQQNKAINAWTEVVGAEIAEVAKPLTIRNKVLFVAVESPSWINELHYYSEQIIRRLNRVAGRNVIEKIRWQNSGELSGLGGSEDEDGASEVAVEVEPSPLPEGSPLSAKLEEIKDEGLRNNLRRLIEISLGAKKREEDNKAEGEFHKEGKEEGESK